MQKNPCLIRKLREEVVFLERRIKVVELDCRWESDSITLELERTYFYQLFEIVLVLL